MNRTYPIKPDLHTSTLNFLQLNQDKRLISAIHINLLLLKQLQIPNYDHNVTFDVLMLQEPQIHRLPPTYHQFPPSKFIKNPRAGIICHSRLQASFISQYSTRDICVVRIVHNNSPLILISLYCHQTTDISQLLQNFPSNILQKTIIAVDTNAKSSKWGAQYTCTRGQCFESWLAQHDLHVINNIPHPPSFHQLSGSSHIDATFFSASNLNSLQSWNFLPQEIFGSGHAAFHFQLQTTFQRKHNLNHQYDVKTVDREQFVHIFKDEFYSKPITPPFQTPDQIDTAFSNLANKLHHAFIQTTSIKQPVRIKNPWWNTRLAQLQIQLRGLRSQLKKFPHSLSLQQHYKKTRNLYTHSIRTAKQTWLTKHCQSLSNPFSILKMIKTPPTGAITFAQNGVPILDANKNAEFLLNQLLHNDTEDSEYHTQTQQNIQQQLDQPIHNSPIISTAEIYKALKVMKPYSAPGPDSIRAFMLQWTKNVIAPLLSTLFTKCLQLSHFPTQFKEGNLKIIPKPTATVFDSPKSLRPITLLDVIGKLFERVILHRLESHINPLLDQDQLGFSKGASTEIAHALFLNHLESSVHKSKGLAIIQLDIASAFDKVWHPALLKSLIDLKTPLYLCKIIANFLSKRNISMTYAQGFASKFLSLSVPQGAVLSPILWKIFLNPLLLHLANIKVLKKFFWADDGLLSIPYTKNNLQQLHSQLLHVFQILHEWCFQNKASINVTPGKTNLVCFQTHTLVNIQINTPFGPVTSTDSLKFLGVTFDCKLTFKQHIQKQITNYHILKQSMTIYFAKSLKLSPRIIQSIFTAVILPKFFYSSTTWYSIIQSKTTVQSIQYFLNDCARHTTRCFKTTPINLLLAFANMPTASQTIKHQTLLRITRLIHQPNSTLRAILANRPHSRTFHILNQLLLQSNIPLKFSPSIDKFFKYTQHKLHNVIISFNFDRFISAQPNHLIAFTDGSKHDNQTGSAFACFQNTNFTSSSPTKFQLRLNNCCSHNDAEQWAILALLLSLCNTFSTHFQTSPLPFIPTELYSTTHPTKHYTLIFPTLKSLTPSHNHIHIYTDSQICLAGLTNPTQSSNQHNFCMMLNIMYSLPISFHFHWIPAHKSHYGNELADSLAKHATSLLHLPIITPIPYSTKETCKMTLNSQLNSILEQNWNEITIVKPIIKKFFTNFNQFSGFQKSSYKFPFLAGIVTGHLPNFAHLYRMNIVSGPSCPRCLCIDDLNHFMFHCLRFQPQRHQLLQKLNLNSSQFNLDFLYAAFNTNNYEQLKLINEYLELTIC
jgi:Reverse transcriptase (RNA-dependent DNA polymerase)/Endonuclease-reverse transcriptase/RNase H